MSAWACAHTHERRPNLSPPHPHQHKQNSVINAFLTDFLHEQRGMSVAGATALMFIFGLGCFAGNLAGGVLGQVRVCVVCVCVCLC